MILSGIYPECILLTGASGFVGRALWARARQARIGVKGVVRGLLSADAADAGGVTGPTLTADADWCTLLTGCDAVVHAAARVHVMRETERDPLGAFRAVNVEGTLALARQAAVCGVRRFVFVSSIKVNGEISPVGVPFRADDIPAPQDPYAISKAEAEAGLLRLSEQTGMAVTIVRPPLVYGPGVKGNLFTLMRWLKAGVPLPLGAIRNQRTLVGLENLVDLIFHCLCSPAAANQIFLAGDRESLSTPDLLRELAQAVGGHARLLPVPVRLLERGAQLLGRGAMMQRLCGNLQVDISKAREILGWTPPVSLHAGLMQLQHGYVPGQGIVS